MLVNFFQTTRHNDPEEGIFMVNKQPTGQILCHVCIIFRNEIVNKGRRIILNEDYYTDIIDSKIGHKQPSGNASTFNLTLAIRANMSHTKHCNCNRPNNDAFTSPELSCGGNTQPTFRS
jgi:hypothetical protein